jgi:nucleoside-diphosphate-sugar epimerase
LDQQQSTLEGMGGLKMRVLLTGHHGYIGAVLAPMLSEAGHEVVGLDNDLYYSCTYGEWKESIPSIKKDVRDVELSDVEGYDAILHLAGLSNDPLGDLNPDLTLEINHQASVNLARLAKRAGVQRFIFSSSCSNYGAAGDDFLDESSEFNPVTIYGRSKVLVEQDISALADDSFSPTFLRNATAYGVSPFLRFDLVLNNLTAWAFSTGQVYLKSDGSPWRPIVHIEDISRAFLAVLHAPTEKIHSEAFNVGQTSENYRVRELAQIVAETVPGGEVSFAPDAGPDKRNYRVNCDKIQQVLPEFKPQWTARRGAQELYESYKRMGIVLDDFEGPRYKRIAHIKKLIDSGEITQKLRWSGAGESRETEQPLPASQISPEQAA